VSTVLEGVRTRHLRIDELTIPHRAFTVVTGPSGAGKSTLLLDTLHAESRRRLDELVAVEKQRLVANVPRPPIDRASGLLPTLAHARETPGVAGRRSLAALSGIDDALALLAVRDGTLACPRCDEPMRARTADAIADALLAPGGSARVTIYAPLGQVDDTRRGELLTEGWVRVRVGGKLAPLEETNAPFTGDVVVDRIALRDGVRGRLVDALELAWRLGNGLAIVAPEGGTEEVASVEARCPTCTLSISRTTPEDLVWSSPKSRCVTCRGSGEVLALDAARAVDRSRSLEGGAIRAWGPATAAAKPLLAELAKAHGLAPKQPLGAQDAARVDAALGLAPTGVAFTVLSELVARAEDGDDGDLPRARSFLVHVACPACDATGRSDAFRAHRLGGERLTALERASLVDARAVLFPRDAERAPRFRAVWRELERRVATACGLGLGHLSLHREGRTLSRGELQRARLVAQIGAPLEAVMHLLDEPTDGLHPLDAQSVLDAIRTLVTEGATVVSIAHDPLTIAGADHAVVLGPGAGREGGRVVAAGNPHEVAPPRPRRKRPRGRRGGAAWVLASCTKHHLAGDHVRVPEGALVTFTGVSGSGKSTLLREGLGVAAEARRFGFEAPEGHGKLEGRAPSTVVFVDDRPLARGTRSTVASAIGVFDLLREAYAATAEARARGYTAGRFSHNVRGGRCEHCEGTGLEPGALDRYAEQACVACGGSRYNRETNEVRLHGHGIGELLARPVSDVVELLRGNTKIAPRLDALVTLGLGYLALGQSTASLSSGEAKRVVLGKTLARGDLEDALVLLDEPTAGLSADDVECVLDATEQLRARGATLVITEHRPAVIAASDWVVELGPGPGPQGGRIVVQGTLDDVLACDASVTRRAFALGAC
jgi:excinuclease ABC subunit A